jgi:hypothetical protein
MDLCPFTPPTLFTAPCCPKCWKTIISIQTKNEQFKVLAFSESVVGSSTSITAYRNLAAIFICQISTIFSKNSLLFSFLICLPDRTWNRILESCFHCVTSWVKTVLSQEKNCEIIQVLRTSWHSSQFLALVCLLALSRHILDWPSHLAES